VKQPRLRKPLLPPFITSLRKRGVNGYDFVPADREPRPAGPQARPSDAPPPQPPPEPPKAEPPPPYQQAYEQAERAYKEAAATDSMRPEVQPTKGKSGRVVGCFFTIVSWLLIGMISNQCRHGGLNTSDYRKHLDEATGVNSEPPVVAATPKAMATPIWVSPHNSRTDPLDWSGMSKEEGVRLWKRLPLGTWVQDSDGKVFQKTTLPDLEIATYQEPTQTEKDANWQRILDMRAATGPSLGGSLGAVNA